MIDVSPRFPKARRRIGRDGDCLHRKSLYLNGICATPDAALSSKTAVQVRKAITEPYKLKEKNFRLGQQKF